MKQSIRGGQLPESFEDFCKLNALGKLQYYQCVSCQEPHGQAETTSPAGWRETQISGLCEPCYDALLGESE